MYQKKGRIIFTLATTIILLLTFSPKSSAQIPRGLPPLKIVQLGDSYSAGNGARSATGEVNYYSVSGCYRSPTNWGGQYAESLKDKFNVTYINRACSGAVVDNITNTRDMGTIFKKLGESCPTPEYPDEENYVETSSITCKRFIKAQITAVDKSVDLVLMTMGGNDLKFSTIVQDCFSVLRTPITCESDVNNARQIISDPLKLKSNLIDTFAAIKKNLRPGAKIAYVAYPQLSLDVPYKLEIWSEYGLLASYDAGAKIRDLSLAGEALQKEAVDAANANAEENYIVFYNGTKPLFAGHEPDPSLTKENPDRWINEFPLSSPMAEWYHPNPLGLESWAKALSPFETFGAGSGLLAARANVDVAFVVDNTGSMGDDIAQVRADLSSLVAQLAKTAESYRVAVVSYRDFPQRTGWTGDYPSKVNQTFTEDPALIQAAINSLTAQGGGDWQETVFSGIQAAVDLPWRPGVTKFAIVIGDAPPLSPEPYTNLTTAQIVANSNAVDPVQVIGVDTGGLNATGVVGQIANGTGGLIVQGTTGLTTKISEILDRAVKQPFAWLGQAYSGKIGQPIIFDASGSYDPSGSLITLYEWDFNGDGIFDLQTQAPTATHTYDAAFNNFVVVRVTSQGGTALASARTVVNEAGFASQGDEKSCELDANGYSIMLDGDGRIIPCKADSLPTSGLPGVKEITGNSPPVLSVIGDQSTQYSDSLSFITLAHDPDNLASELSFSASGLPDNLVLINNGDGTATISGIVNVAPSTYTAQITVTDPGGLSDTKPVNIVVTPEDARATYTGPLMVSTGSTSVSTATIPLRATIQDITAVDPIGDPNPGDITKATVTFVNRESGAVLCSAAPVLLDPAISTVGSATCNWTANIGANDGVDFTIGVIVGGYYARNSSDEDTVVVVSKPVSNFITGGGYFVNQTSSGKYAGDLGARTNFGVNIKFTSKLTNLQGRVNIIVRQNGHIYQIKSTSLSSLVAVPYNLAKPSTGTAELLGKATISDITDPMNPVSLEGGSTLQVVMKDNGEPGNADTISISIWGKDGKLLFSSNWNGTKTIPQTIDGGNLQIH